MRRKFFYRLQSDASSIYWEPFDKFEMIGLGLAPLTRYVVANDADEARELAKGDLKEGQHLEWNSIQEDPTPVVILGWDVAFWDIVRVLVKWSLAAVPALLILAIVWAIVTGIVASIASLFG